MTHKKSFQSDNPLEHYTEFWSEALQRIDAIQNLLYSEFADLEVKYKDFEDKYYTINNLTKEMVSLYSGFNTLNGHEDLMRLKTIVERYEENYTRKGIDFKIIHHLLDKVLQMRSESFDNFPAVEHLEKIEVSLIEEENHVQQNETSYFNRPYKWISFSRNNSFFMTPFDTFTLISNNNMNIENLPQLNWHRAYDDDNNDFQFRELMTLQDTYIEPTLFICIDNRFYYPADKLMKKIFSHNDIISDKIEDFDSEHDKPFIGRVKIFGKNHIYLKEEDTIDSDE